MESKEIVCPACKQSTAQFQEHVAQCLQTDQFTVYQKSIRFGNLSFCKGCSTMFRIDQFKIHAKNCNRTVRSTQSRRSDIGIQQFETIRKKQKVQEIEQVEHMLQTIEKVEKGNEEKISVEKFRENLPTLCINYLQAAIYPELLNWLNHNSGMSQIVLFNLFAKFTNQLSKKLKQIIPEVTMAKLSNFYSKINWNQILGKIQNLFDKDFILKKLQNYQEKQKARILKNLNKFYDQYPNVFQKFVVKTIKSTPQLERNKLPLMAKDFLLLYERLLKTNQKGFIHLAIDLMLIFQSGVRFPSSMSSLKEDIQKILKKRKTDKSVNSINTVLTKTKVSFSLVLDEQLLELIELIGWNGFLEKRIYERLSSYFPFTCYSLRRGYACFIFLCHENSSINATQQILAHKSQQSTGYYLQQVIDANMTRYKSRLRVAGLKTQSKLLQKEWQDSLSIKHIQLDEDSFAKAYHRLKSQISVEQYFVFDQKQIFSAPLPVPQVAGDIPIENEDGQLIDDDEEEEEEDKSIKQIHINGRTFTFGLGSFDQFALYGASEAKCSQCQKCAYFCLFCERKYCQQHVQRFCRCMRINYSDQRMLNLQIENQSTNIQFQMPQNYVGDCKENRAFQSIRTLIHARQLYFTNVSVEDRQLFQYPLYLNAPKIKLKHFHDYVALGYFPPIQLGTFGDTSIQGTGFGLYATEDIPNNVFIGEYAADKVKLSQSRFMRRSDMIFNLFDAEDPAQSLVIGPIKFCGYVPLINTGKGKQNNCKSLKGYVNGTLRIIIYTTRIIYKGEQLLYQYARGADQAQNKQVQQQVDFVAQNIYRGIKNVNSNCYINVILQVFSFCKIELSLENSDEPLLVELRNFLKNEAQVFNPDLFLSAFHDKWRSIFPQGDQGDSCEVFIKLVDLLVEKKALENEVFLIKEKIHLICQNHHAKELQETHKVLILPMTSLIEEIRHNSETTLRWMCSSCSKEVEGIKKSQFVFGEYLMIVFQRFDNHGNKNTGAKNVPAQMELRKDQKYVLRVLIVHIGNTAKRGHYHFIDHSKKLIVSDAFTRPYLQPSYGQVYMALYKKSE